MSRRAPLLSFGRGAGWPGARVCDGTLDALFIGNVTKFFEPMDTTSRSTRTMDGAEIAKSARWTEAASPAAA